MTITDNRRRVVMCAAATALLLQMSSLGANENDNGRGDAHGNRAILVTFTKWRVNAPACRPSSRERPGVVQRASSSRRCSSAIDCVPEPEKQPDAARGRLRGADGGLRADAGGLWAERRSFLHGAPQRRAGCGGVRPARRGGSRDGGRARACTLSSTPHSSAPTDFACEDAPIGTTCFEGTLRIEGL